MDREGAVSVVLVSLLTTSISSCNELLTSVTLPRMRFHQSLVFLLVLAGSVFAQDLKPLTDRLAAIARNARMAVCGGNCQVVKVSISVASEARQPPTASAWAQLPPSFQVPALHAFL